MYSYNIYDAYCHQICWLSCQLVTIITVEASPLLMMECHLSDSDYLAFIFVDINLLVSFLALIKGRICLCQHLLDCFHFITKVVFDFQLLQITDSKMAKLI